MNKRDFSTEIYKRYGRITRARNCFLYTAKGVRLTDLYQEDGRAILGWRGDAAFTFFKNFLTKGLTGSFKCEDFSRVEKAVSKTLNSKRRVFYFSSKNETLKQALQISPENTTVWHPWNNSNINIENADCIIMAPPLPWTDTIYILAVKETCLKNANIPSIFIPFPMEVAIAKSFYNLISEENKRQEKDWFIYDTVITKYFIRKGPYLYPKIPAEKYDSFILHCLDQGIIINPDYNSPSIVPYGADKGVFTKLKNSPFSF